MTDIVQEIWKKIGQKFGDADIEASGDHRRLVDKDGKVIFSYRMDRERTRPHVHEETTSHRGGAEHEPHSR